jgi:hypothetical protein
MTKIAELQDYVQRAVEEMAAKRYEAGFHAGYVDALNCLRTVLNDLQSDLQYPKDSPEAPAAPEEGRPAATPSNGGNESSTSQNDVLAYPPAIRRAYEYLAAHPGLTAVGLGDKIGTRNTAYKLVAAGLAENRDGKFYAKSGASA